MSRYLNALEEIAVVARDLVGDHCSEHAPFQAGCSTCRMLQLLDFVDSAPMEDS